MNDLETKGFSMSAKSALLVGAATLLVLLVSVDLYSEEGLGRTVVVLRSGHRLEGVVVKQTSKSLFLDVGFTIFPLPAEEVREVREIVDRSTLAAHAGTTNGGVGGGPEGKVCTVSDSIFQTAELEPGTIEVKSRIVGESVVQIVCLGKSGSGFIVNRDQGFVVTNFHVIEREQDIAVVLYVREPNGLRKVKTDAVRIVALNPFFDLALLRIEDSKGVKLKNVYLGDYARVRVGDPVFAIGSPLGLERTVSEGIVSNRNRALTGFLLIQTTAPINPGNSGGPLFNERGEVIGVTNLKVPAGESLGFAIPVHYVKDFLRNREAFAFDKDNPNTGIRYLSPPPKKAPQSTANAQSATRRN